MMSRQRSKLFLGFAIAGLFQGLALSAWAAEIPAAVDRTGAVPDAVIAVKNVCAWPNLTLLPDGSIIATIHNQPAHLRLPSDVDCWGSDDQGKTWKKRGTPAPRDTESTARGNAAAGVANNGDLIVISGGWSDPQGPNRGKVLAPILSRSHDGGTSWEINREGIHPPKSSGAADGSRQGRYYIPFGDIYAGNDGALRVALYGDGDATVLRSDDDGRTWTDPISFDLTSRVLEPAFLHVGGGKWLMASRLDGLELYESQDDARTWTKGQRLTDPAAHPGHLLLLKNGRIVLTYGDRNLPRGVDAIFSDDQGKTWSEPRRLLSFKGDGGYPSSVELPDGQILTAYYAIDAAGHKGYHMGVVTWDAAKSWSHE